VDLDAVLPCDSAAGVGDAADDGSDVDPGPVFHPGMDAEDADVAPGDTDCGGPTWWIGVVVALLAVRRYETVVISPFRSG